MKKKQFIWPPLWTQSSLTHLCAADFSAKEQKNTTWLYYRPNMMPYLVLFQGSEEPRPLQTSILRSSLQSSSLFFSFIYLFYFLRHLRRCGVLIVSGVSVGTDCVLYADHSLHWPSAFKNRVKQQLYCDSTSGWNLQNKRNSISGGKNTEKPQLELFFFL